MPIRELSMELGSRSPAKASIRKVEMKLAPVGEKAHSFTNALRIQQSFTSGVERKALLWLAGHVPSGITSDHLTLVGLVSMALAFASYFFARWNRSGLLVVDVCLALNWFGDSMDGTLARVRNRQRPRYGFYVDHVIDSVGALFLMCGLALSRYISWQVAVAMLIAFLLLSIESYLASYALGIFRMSFWRFGPTEIRLILALGNIALWLRPNARVRWFSLRLFDFGGLVATAGMAIMFMVAAGYHTAALYRQETLP
jgi:archaetidylinositol phosphate synthase